jgi:hypothetical protein
MIEDRMNALLDVKHLVMVHQAGAKQYNDQDPLIQFCIGQETACTLIIQEIDKLLNQEDKEIYLKVLMDWVDRKVGKKHESN